MTVEKAIEILSDIGDINRCCAEDAEALDMAIRALEQQPCKDCISRKQALKETKALIRGDYDPEYIIETLKMLPPVTPKALEQQPCEDCISREATIEAIYKKYIGGKDTIENAPINDLYAEGLAEAVDAVWDLPSVTPTRPTAQWERFKDDYNNCSKCGGLVKFYHKYKYCPKCGAKMQEVEE